MINPFLLTRIKKNNYFSCLGINCFRFSPFIQGLFDLTEEQINAVLTYIETNYTQVELEYQQVLKETEELRQYYEEKNRALFAKIALKQPKPENKLAWEKLQESKLKREKHDFFD
jgi:hypothetical protein